MCTHLTIKVALAPRSIHPSFVNQKSPIKGWHCPFYPNTLYTDDTVTLWPGYYFETPVFKALFADPFPGTLYLLNRQIALWGERLETLTVQKEFCVSRNRKRKCLPINLNGILIFRILKIIIFVNIPVENCILLPEDWMTVESYRCARIPLLPIKKTMLLIFLYSAGPSGPR